MMPRLCLRFLPSMRWSEMQIMVMLNSYLYFMISFIRVTVTLSYLNKTSKPFTYNFCSSADSCPASRSVKINGNSDAIEEGFK
jgi:hypothetical protein